jgi:uncharacterized protein HemY
MIKELIYILILLLGILVGLILAKLCKDEIKNWRKRMIIISVICLIIALIIVFSNFTYKIPVIITLIFIAITDLTIVWKSYRIKSKKK